MICPYCRLEHDGICAAAATITHEHAVGAAAPAPIDSVNEGHYQIEGEHARGGLGRILLARDRRLSRPVAIKELLRRTPEAEARFLHEASVTAQLQHPGVVPIYEVGRRASGAPFYAMKLISGTSLHALISSSTTFESRLALLTNVVAVAEAVAYAHSQGVIHRDLKPANVMVGEFGETVVVDWGLAKRRDASEPEGQAVSDQAAAFTQSGQIVGTPQYMPPEQARGEPLDERADVYALGALLYHLLVGQPPYPGESSEEVLAAVGAGAPPPIDARLPEAPPELVAIVEKAMAREREERYANASELAADLRRFQTGQLVSSHHYSTSQLARRWLGRHRLPVAVSLLAATALAVTAGLSVRRIVAERDRAYKQRAAAEELTQFMLSDLMRQLQPLGRLDVLDGVDAKVDAYYHALESVEGTLDPPSLERRGKALASLASLELARGNTKYALELWQKSARLVAGLPQTPALIADQAEDVSLRVSAQTELGHVKEAKADLAEATARVRAALITAPGNWELRAVLLKLLYSRSLMDRAAGERQTEVATLDEGRALAETLLRQRPDDKDVLTDQLRLQQLNILGRLSGLDTVMGRGDDARATAAECVRLAQASVAREPEQARWLRTMTGCLQSQANERQLHGDFDGALTAVQALCKVREQLSARDPGNATWQMGLADALNYRAQIFTMKGMLDEALADDQTATEVNDRLLAREPSNVDWIENSLDILASLGDIELRRHDREAALRVFRTGLARATQLLARDRTNVDWRSEASIFHNRLGEALTASGHAKEGLPEVKASLAIDLDISRAQPADTGFLLRVAHGHVALADAELALHDPDALAEYRAAQAMLEAMMAKDPADAQNPAELGRALVGAGEAQRDDADAARASFRRAVEIMTPLAKAGKLDPDYRAVFAKAQRLADGTKPAR